MAKGLLRSAALGYLALILLGPVAMIAYRTFEHGIGPVWDALTTPAALHALYLSVAVTAIAVPMNVVFGVLAGVLLARRRMPAGSLVNLLSTCRSRCRRWSSVSRCSFSTAAPAGSAAGSP